MPKRHTDSAMDLDPFLHRGFFAQCAQFDVRIFSGAVRLFIREYSHLF
jgi:hypothetical protein